MVTIAAVVSAIVSTDVVSETAIHIQYFICLKKFILGKSSYVGITYDFRFGGEGDSWLKQKVLPLVLL